MIQNPGGSITERAFSPCVRGLALKLFLRALPDPVRVHDADAGSGRLYSGEPLTYGLEPR